MFTKITQEVTNLMKSGALQPFNDFQFNKGEEKKIPGRNTRRFH